jgi:hypothetical protein
VISYLQFSWKPGPEPAVLLDATECDPHPRVFHEDACEKVAAVFAEWHVLRKRILDLHDVLHCPQSITTTAQATQGTSCQTVSSHLVCQTVSSHLVCQTVSSQLVCQTVKKAISQSDLSDRLLTTSRMRPAARVSQCVRALAAK